MKQESLRENWSSLLIPVALVLGLVALLTIDGEGAARDVMPANVLESWLRIIVGYLAVGAEIAAAIIIAVGIVRGLIGYVGKMFLDLELYADQTEVIRLKLGRVLTLGLEFAVASDILRTAVAPTRQDILNLAAIVMLRSLLIYFLEIEIRQSEDRREIEWERKHAHEEAGEEPDSSEEGISET